MTTPAGTPRRSAPRAALRAGRGAYLGGSKVVKPLNAVAGLAASIIAVAAAFAVGANTGPAPAAAAPSGTGVIYGDRSVVTLATGATGAQKSAAITRYCSMGRIVSATDTDGVTTIYCAAP